MKNQCNLGIIAVTDHVGTYFLQNCVPIFIFSTRAKFAPTCTMNTNYYTVTKVNLWVEISLANSKLTKLTSS